MTIHCSHPLISIKALIQLDDVWSCSPCLHTDNFVMKNVRLPLLSECGDWLKHKRTDVELLQLMVHKMTKSDDDSLTSIEQRDLLIAQFEQTCQAKFTPGQSLSVRWEGRMCWKWSLVFTTLFTSIALSLLQNFAGFRWRVWQRWDSFISCTRSVLHYQRSCIQ